VAEKLQSRVKGAGSALLMEVNLWFAPQSADPTVCGQGADLLQDFGLFHLI